MLTRERVSTIWRLAYPTLIALSTNLMMSVADLIMVQPLGIRATAAVGVSAFCYTLVLAFMVGIDPAVQGMVARRRGQGSTEPRCLPLNAGLLAALILGVPLMILCEIFAPFLFSLLSSDPEVTRIGVPILRIYYAAILAYGLNSAFRGHWAGSEKPRVHMWISVVLNVINLFGNYVLIYGKFGFPALGAAGAALSTTLSIHLGLLLNFVMSYKRYWKDGFLRALPDRALVKRVFQLAIPSAGQEFFFSLGYLVFFWIIGQVGTRELAAANVLVRITMVLVLLAMCLAVSSATLVSRTLGEGDPEGAAEWGWDAAKLGVIAITTLGLPFVFFPREILAVFLSDPAAVEMAVIPLRMIGLTTGGGTLIYVFAYNLVTIGDGGRVMAISFGTQWLIFLPAAWFLGTVLHYGLLEIWIAQLCYGAVASHLITTRWRQGLWKQVKI